MGGVVSQSGTTTAMRPPASVHAILCWLVCSVVVTQQHSAPCGGAVQLMLEKVKAYEAGTNDDAHVAAELMHTMKSMAFLAAGGALCGLLAGSVTTVRTLESCI